MNFFLVAQVVAKAVLLLYDWCTDSWHEDRYMQRPHLDEFDKSLTERVQVVSATLCRDLRLGGLECPVKGF